MSHLSEALSKYYVRQGNRIIFKNKQSLNQLALLMWQILNFKEIDSSVLSRVLKGERLFSASQLNIFCKILSLTENDEKHLFICLHRDLNARFGLQVKTTYISNTLAQEMLGELTSDIFNTFYQGNYSLIEKKNDLIEQFANAYRLSDGDTKQIQEALGVSLYLSGRTIANGELPSRVIAKIYPLFRQLLVKSQGAQSMLLYGYAHILLCNAYYLAGGYSNTAKKYKFYRASIKYARIATDSLPDDNHESLFALRLIAASACYTQDRETVCYVLKRVEAIIRRQPEQNYINLLHLCATLSKCMATLHIANPFSIREFASNLFSKNLANTGVYEVSDIKEEIDTLLILKAGDKNYMEKRLNTGLELANKYEFSRQKKYFNSLLRTI